MEKRLDEARAEIDEVCRRECLNHFFFNFYAFIYYLFGVFG